MKRAIIQVGAVMTVLGVIVHNVLNVSVAILGVGAVAIGFLVAVVIAAAVSLKRDDNDKRN